MAGRGTVDSSADHAEPVGAVMVPEALVFDPHERVDESGVEVLDRDREPPAAVRRRKGPEGFTHPVRHQH